MQIAIVGLAAAGKTTVFNTLTRGHAETGASAASSFNVGVVKVPDERLDRLAEIFKPKKFVQADVTYVDLPAPPPSSEGRIGTEELPAEHLARLRDSDALLHVVRAFEDFAYPASRGLGRCLARSRAARPRVHPCRPALAERRLERLDDGRHGSQAEREANEREEAILERLQAALVEGRPIRDLELAPTRRRRSAASGF